MPTAQEICQLPGCDKAISQAGGRRRRFCCDQHRAQYWRLTHGQPRQPQVSQSVTLHQQLEKSVHSLEAVLIRARGTLMEVAGQEANARARAQTDEAQAELQRLRGELAERERATQEQLATGAHETETALAAAEFQLRQMVAELAQMAGALKMTNEKAVGLEQRLQEEAVRQREELEQMRARLRASHDRIALMEQRTATDTAHHRAEMAATMERQERSQERLERALAELRVETEARARAEAGGQAAEKRIEELKLELAAMRSGKLKLSP